MIVIALLLSVVLAGYAIRHFAINTDVNQLISTDLPWRQRELAFAQAFQGNEEKILAVVDAPTSELASAASTALARKLAGQPDLFSARAGVVADQGPGRAVAQPAAVGPGSTARARRARA